MNRSILIVLAVALVAPLATAHTPAAPIITCQEGAKGYYHEYIPPVQGNLIVGDDGNLSNCRNNSMQLARQFNPDGGTIGSVACPFIGPQYPCTNYNTGLDQPLLDYDGELDFSQGGAWLFVNTGDGATSGVAACFGSISVGHHSGEVFALDDRGFGPSFMLTSDYSRPGEEGTPDCGDNYVEPCDPNPPAPSTAPEPLNAVFDTYSQTMYSLFGPSGDGCNERDFALTVASDPIAATHITAPFGPGVDGAYNVFLLPDLDRALFPASGHVWTV